MPDTTQIILIVVILVLSSVLTIIGIQVFLILREVQKSVQKTNKILDDTGMISESVAKPVALVSDSITGASRLAGLLGFLRRPKEKEAEK